MLLGVVLVGAGEGRRMQGTGPKLFLELGGRPLLDRAATPFLTHEVVRDLVAVVPEAYVSAATDLLEALARPHRVNVSAIAGGATRQESVRLGLQALPPESPYIAVHDVARPFVTGDLIWRVLEAAEAGGAAIPALSLRDTVKEVEDGRVLRSLPRHRLFAAQTPQIFARGILARAHEQGRHRGDATDDASLVEALGAPVAVVPGEPTNVKITEPSDLLWAEAFLRTGSLEEDQA